MLRVAIAGCGKIADQHVDAIRRIPGAEVVGVCDRERMMAEQLAERRHIRFFGSDLGQLLDTLRPDVVHVTTPPQSHFVLADLCLARGCHVYVEKPFTVTTADAIRLVRRATDRGLKITAGHNLQYTHESIEARELVHKGFLGGPPLHIESYYTYSLADPSYAKALLGEKDHWVRRLPGKLLHNIISHGIAPIAEYVDTDDPLVAAFGSTSPIARRAGADDIIDELRLHVCDGANTTASFVFSTQLAPPVNGCRLYGARGSLAVDHVHRTLTRSQSRGYKSYLNYFLPPLETAREHVRASARNIVRFLRSDFHDDSGLKNLIEAFYVAIREDGPPPISCREIVLTARIMDETFRQLDAQSSGAAPVAEDAEPAAAMTGAAS